MTYQSVKTIHNSSNQTVIVWIEPWGDVHELNSQSAFTIIAESEQAGELEVIQNTDEGFTIFAWQGSTCRVFQGEVLIRDYPIAVPSLPPGMSSRQFVEFIFRGK